MLSQFLYNPISWVKENIKSMKAKALLGRVTRNIKLQGWKLRLDRLKN